MERILYYGDFNNSKSQELFKKSLETARENRADSFIYILPNRELLTSYRTRFIEDLRLTRTLKLYTFDDLALEIVGGDRLLISDDIRDLIIYDLVKDLSEKGSLTSFKDYHRKEGFLKSMSQIIGSFKRSLLRSESLKEGQLGLDYIDEVALIYAGYEDFLEERGLLDREELYFKAIELMEENPMKLDYLDYIVVDHFYDFRPIEKALLRELAQSQLDIYVNIPYRIESKGMLASSLEFLEGLGFKSQELEKKDKNQFEDLASRLFTDSESRVRVSGLGLIEAENMELELKELFKDIKSSLKKGYRPEELVIVAINDQYERAIKEGALSESINLAVDIEKPLLELAFIIESLDLIRLNQEEAFRDIFLKRLLFYYYPLDLKGANKRIYSFLRRIDFTSMEDLRIRLDGLKEFPLAEEDLAGLYDYMEAYENEMDQLNSLESLGEYNEFLRARLEEYAIESRILENCQDLLGLRQNIDIYLGLKEALDEIEEYDPIFSSLESRDYYNILKNSLANKSISLYRGSSSGIKVLRLVNLRGKKYRRIYIPGLSQANYPNIRENNFFLREKNKPELKSLGLDIREYSEELENEIIKFKIALSLGEDAVILSYSRGEAGDIASSFIDEVRRLSLDLEEKSLDYGNILTGDRQDILKLRDLEEYVLYRRDFSQLPRAYLEEYGTRLEEINDNLRLGLARQAGLDRYIGVLEDRDLIGIVEASQENRIYSSSYLELYGKCPYRFLMEKYFGLEDLYEELRSFDPREVGNLYHLCLKDYYEHYREELKEPKAFDYASSLKFLEEILINKARSLNMDLSNRAMALILEISLINLEDFIREDLERIKKDSLRPLDFEKSFGRGYSFFLEGPEKIYLKGFIDRIDINPRGEKILMDYKSGSSSISGLDSMLDGRSMQLPIYLLAEKDARAAIYGNIRRQEFKAGLVRKGSISKYLARKNTIETEDDYGEILGEFQAIIQATVASIKKGNFKIEPKECSSYCIYRDICRYEDRVVLEDDIE